MSTTAELNMEIPTGPVDKAVKALALLALQAKETAAVTARANKDQTTAAMQMAKAHHVEASAALRVVTADKSSTSASIAAAKSTAANGRAAYDAARAADAKASATLRMAQADLRSAAAAHESAKAMEQQRGSARQMGLTAGVQTAHMTNMAAQFQDIGVTAAMGLNPMMIGLQQGTQMSLVMSDAVGRAGLAGGLRILGSGMLALLSPLSLLVIGFVALLAYLVQITDWTAVLKSSLEFLSKNLYDIAKAALVVGVALAIAFAPQIFRSTVSFLGAILSGTKALIAANIKLAMSNPYTAIVLAIAVALAAVYYFRDEIKQSIGVDVVATWLHMGNKIIAIMVAAFNAVVGVVENFGTLMVDQWKSIINVMIDHLNRFIEGAAQGFASLLATFPLFSGLGGLDITVPDIPQLETSGTLTEIGRIASATIAASDDLNYFGNAIGAVNDSLGAVNDSLREGAGVASRYLDSLAAGLAGGAAATAAAGAGGHGRSANAGGERANRQQVSDFVKMMSEYDAQINQLVREASAIGMLGLEYKQAAALNEMLTKAEQSGIPVSQATIALLREKANAVATLQQRNEEMQHYWTTFRSSNEEEDHYTQQIELLNLTGEAAARLAASHRFLNDEVYRGIVLTESQKTALSQAAVDADAARIAYESAKAFKDQSESMAIATSEANANRVTMNDNAAVVAETTMALRLLNDERFRGIKLSETDRERLISAAGALAVLNEQNRIMSDNLKFAQDMSRGVFEDMFSRLREGESVWKAFGNTALNVLNKIIDRLFDLSLDMLFAGGGQGSGVTGFLSGAVNSLFNVGQGAGAAAAPQKFATGGVFTNGMVNSPTMFNMGEMGEAGPEAIMPLKRGPDGSLGVQMNGKSRPSPSSVNVNITNNHSLSGALSSNDIVESNRAMAQQTMEQVRQSVSSWMREEQRNGTV